MQKPRFFSLQLGGGELIKNSDDFDENAQPAQREAAFFSVGRGLMKKLQGFFEKSW